MGVVSRLDNTLSFFILFANLSLHPGQQPKGTNSIYFETGHSQSWIVDERRFR